MFQNKIYILCSADFIRLNVVIQINKGGSCIIHVANSDSVSPRHP